MARIEEIDSAIEKIDQEIKQKQKKKQELMFERKKAEEKEFLTTAKESGYSASELKELVKMVPRDKYTAMKAEKSNNTVKESIGNDEV